MTDSYPSSIAIPLPQFRCVVVDPVADRGQVVAAIADSTTTHLLVADAVRRHNVKLELPPYQTPEWHRARTGLEEFGTLLETAGWKADLFCCAPPDDRLQEVYDFCLKFGTPRAEGVLVGDWKALSTLQEHCHVWLKVRVAERGGLFYWALDHVDKVQMEILDVQKAEDIQARLAIIPDIRHRLRHGQRVMMAHQFGERTVKCWDACHRELTQRQLGKARDDYHVYLHPTDGTLQAQVTRFDQFVDETNPGSMYPGGIYGLIGKTPQELVISIPVRKSFQEILDDGKWRVDPKVRKVFADAVLGYERVRAPLYPLSPAQRIGFIEEHPTVCCKKDLGEGFKSGFWYSLRTVAAIVERMSSRPNLQGELEDILSIGNELMVYICGEGGREYSFIDGRFKREDAVITQLGGSLRIKPDFGMSVLVEHFEIPEVADVSQTKKAEFQKAQDGIAEIQKFVDEFINV